MYPSHHLALQETVAEGGLLLTEQAQGAPVRRGHFAARNRLLVALSCAVVVVECPEHSGALITAKVAAEQQRPVWVVPAMPVAGLQGATPCSSTRSLPCSPPGLIRHLGAGPCQRHQCPCALTLLLSSEQQVLLNALGDGASLEELSRDLNRSTGSLAKALLALELEGRVLCESGLRWRPIPG